MLLNHGTCWMTQIHMNLTRLQSSMSSAILSHRCYHPSWFLVWATSCHILPRLGPCAGWASIKWRGLTPHLHHNTVALWERARELEQQGSEPALRSHLSSHSSAKFHVLCYPFTSLLPPLLILGLGNLLPHLATTGPLLAGWASIKWRGLTPHLHQKQGGDLYKMDGSNPPPAP